MIIKSCAYRNYTRRMMVHLRITQRTRAKRARFGAYLNLRVTTHAHSARYITHTHTLEHIQPFSYNLMFPRVLAGACTRASLALYAHEMSHLLPHISASRRRRRRRRMSAPVRDETRVRVWSSRRRECNVRPTSPQPLCTTYMLVVHIIYNDG